MKHKVRELEGALLDAAVALVEGIDNVAVWSHFERREWGPSTDWSQGGPIIQRERIIPTWDGIKLHWYSELEHTAPNNGVQRSYAVGPTLLIAAMRAYVASRMGDEVELP